MIDLTKIIAGEAGQRETFEELVCQIARRDPPATALEYRRIHGAGGDGGVEAVWILDDGGEHGYQAKFYTVSRNVDWGAIDDSVKTALATHPTLTTMYIAIACALTGQTQRQTTKGRPQISGWGQWENHKARWEAQAKGLGRTITFVPWTAPDLEAKLTEPKMVGLVDYWFGSIELSPAWLAAQCRRTVDALEERYHPEDHVDVSTRAAFDGLLRNQAYRAMLVKARADLLEASKLGGRPSRNAAENAQLDQLAAKIQAFAESTRVLKSPGQNPLAYAAWHSICDDLLKLSFDASQAARSEREALKASSSVDGDPVSAEASPTIAGLDYLIEALRKLQSATRNFLGEIGSPACQSDQSRFLLFNGRAGSGKSHLIASEVERALQAGSPAMFLLGTDFTQHGTAETQILSHFELTGKDFEHLLGAMDARAEAAGTRGLIAIDAINEGAGAPLWRSALQAFAKRVLAFPNLTLCVSCRSEYYPQLITPAIEEMAANVEVSGFDTPDEIERAARVYMDRRGIVRPATPWLNPEFSNPLFLRTTCLALERAGRKTFPRGMRGTSEVLAFLLESTGRHLGTDYDGSETLVQPVRRALLSLAKQMATTRTDYVTRPDAHRLVENAFAGIAPPPGKTWLELLRFRGLLRLDPSPDFDPADPMSAPEDVVRFSFQRFQDHLVARALLEPVKDPTGLFAQSGPLHFILGKYGIEWQWRGLFYALGLYCADHYKTEIVDLLPGGEARWWEHYEVKDAFVESIRWRSATAFSDRTLVLLNRLGRSEEDVVSLLVELAMVVDHPWNAKLLHKNLIGRPLPKRDAFWTCAINDAHGDTAHPAWRLIDWCLNAGIRSAEDDALALAALTLAWCQSSTSAILRDNATKALICVLAERPSLTPLLFKAFAECDDPYVVERLYAAVYGAGLRTLEPRHLAIFAEAVWTHCFAKGEPPEHLLARDYARGVIELASTAAALPEHIEIAQCRPPYGSKAPVFNVTEARVEARSARVGADAILYSCYKGLADFGRYILENRVKRFAAAPLTGPRPLTFEETGRSFVDQVVVGRPDVLEAFEELRAAYGTKSIIFQRDPFSVSISKGDVPRIKRAEKAFLALLSPEDAQRFKLEAKEWAKGGSDHRWLIPGKGKGKEIDAHRAKLWVANRTISLGWTKKLFGNDRTRDARHEDHGRVERIGKKYQRIALMELMARLADNFWLKPDWGQPARVYEDPLDTEFVRDIEPSIMPSDAEAPSPAELPNIPPLACAALPGDQRKGWVFDADLAPQRLSLALGSDLTDDGWVALYRYASQDIDVNVEHKKSFLDTPWVQSEFYFLALLLFPQEDRDRFVAETEANADDFHEWLPSQRVDGPYIGELGRRATWGADLWSTLDVRGPEERSYRVIKPTVDFSWESHMDGSLPDGFSRHVPISWLVAELGLRGDPANLGIYRDAQDVPIIVTSERSGHSAALIRREALMLLTEAHGLSPVWTVIGERTAVEDETRRRPDTRVRYNGLLWLEGVKPKLRHWSRPD